MTFATPPPPADPTSAEMQLEPTESDGAPTEPELVAPRGLVAFTIAAFFVVAALAVLWPPTALLGAPPRAPDYWRPTAAQRAEMTHADDALLTAVAEDDAERAFAASWSRWLAREAAIGASRVAEDPEARWARAELEEAIYRIGTTRGIDAVRAASVRLGRRARELLVAAIPEARAAGQPLASWLMRAPEGTATFALRSGFGGLGLALAQTGAADDGTIDDDEALVVEALVALRVLESTSRLGTRAPELPSDRARLLLAFRVEAHAGLDLPRRLTLLEALSAEDPSYPAHFVAGLLLERADRFDAAVGLFEKAIVAGEEVRIARQHLAWLKRKT